MIVSDMHTHSTFSTDGRAPLDEMISTGKSLGLKYYGVSEHFDLDEYSIKLYGTIDEAAYFLRARELQQIFNDGDFTFIAGGEFNYVTDEEVFEKFNRINELYKPDFAVNSIHIVDGEECFRREYFSGKSKAYAYSRYLEQVLKSVDAPYKFDIIGHLGYVSRNAPYDDPMIYYEEFSDLYDAILKRIIDRNIILEVNSQSRGAGCDFLPNVDVLSRYYELGGRAISFGSDAHFPSRVAEKRDVVCAALKKIGFTHITVPNKGERIKVEI